jgi:hypothetical protein
VCTQHASRSNHITASLQQLQHLQKSAQEEQVTRLLSQRSIDPYWGRELRRVDRPSARALLPLLDASNCIGFTPGPSMVRSGSLFDYVLAQKVSKWRVTLHHARWPLVALQ